MIITITCKFGRAVSELNVYIGPEPLCHGTVKPAYPQQAFEIFCPGSDHLTSKIKLKLEPVGFYGFNPKGFIEIGPANLHPQVPYTGGIVGGCSSMKRIESVQGGSGGLGMMHFTKRVA